MGFFKALVSTVINVAGLPIEIAKDVVTFGGAATEQGESYTRKKLEEIKEEAGGE